jgi:hypothetical protein
MNEDRTKEDRREEGVLRSEAQPILVSNVTNRATERRRLSGLPVSRTTEGSERGAFHGAKRSDMRLSPNDFLAKGRLAEERSDGVRAEPKASLKQRVPPLPWGLAWGEGKGVRGTVTGVTFFRLFFRRIYDL